MTDDHRLILARCIMPYPFATEGTPQDKPHLASLRRSAWEAVDRMDAAFKAAGYAIIKLDADNGKPSE